MNFFLFFVFTGVLLGEKTTNLFNFGTRHSLLSTCKRKFNELKKSQQNGREL
jgi:hypothetical protein